jgi:hypothetical protein
MECISNSMGGKRVDLLGVEVGNRGTVRVSKDVALARPAVLHPPRRDTDNHVSCPDFRPGILPEQHENDTVAINS